MREWFLDHIWITYAIIYVLVVYVYNNVFRARKLPLLKDALVYILIAVGNLVLLWFQLLGLPIIQSLLVAVILMAMVRVRYFVEGRAKRKAAQEGADRSTNG